MEIRAKGKVYLVYCPSRIVWEAFRYGGLFRIEWLEVSPSGTPNADLESLRDLATEASERGDLIFCGYTSGDGDDEEINSEVLRNTLSKLLQIEVPPHEYVTNLDRISQDLALQPLQKGEVLLLFNPYYDADDCEKSLISARVAVPTDKLEDEPLPMAMPANISMFEVMVVFCSETD